MLRGLRSSHVPKGVVAVIFCCGVAAILAFIFFIGITGPDGVEVMDLID